MQKIAKFEKITGMQFQLDWNFEEDIIQAYENIRLPKRATTGSAGYDFISPLRFTLQPRQSILIPTGLRCKIADGWVLQIFPRSGLGFRYRLQLNNTVGIIDSDYYYAENEGHIQIKVTNDSVDGKELTIGAGDAFAQGVFLPFGITEDDEVTEKRVGGFGSTSEPKSVRRIL